MKVIDTHSHFNLHQFGHDLPEAIARMENAGVGTICVGTDATTSDHAVRLAQNYYSIWACVGQHPTEWGKEFNVAAFTKLARESRTVAIGECGLDYYREIDRKAKPEQKALFRTQIELAHACDLPLMLHIRAEPADPSGAGRHGNMDAYHDALAMLQEMRSQWVMMRGTAHFFAGTPEIAQEFLNLGFYISFSGVITIFPEYEELVRIVPIDRILPETDAPFAAPVPYRGTRNEPMYVLEVVKKIADIKGLSIEDTEAQLLANTKRLFSI